MIPLENEVSLRISDPFENYERLLENNQAFTAITRDGIVYLLYKGQTCHVSNAGTKTGARPRDSPKLQRLKHDWVIVY